MSILMKRSLYVKGSLFIFQISQRLKQKKNASFELKGQEWHIIQEITMFLSFQSTAGNKIYISLCHTI